MEAVAAIPSLVAASLLIVSVLLLDTNSIIQQHGSVGMTRGQDASELAAICLEAD